MNKGNSAVKKKPQSCGALARMTEEQAERKANYINEHYRNKGKGHITYTAQSCPKCGFWHAMRNPQAVPVAEAVA